MFNFKRIADPVHGSIGLSASEVSLISTKAFQRLRNVKQLGLAHFAFPAADYSRFSHSVGVCHVTGRILESLNRALSQKLKPSDIQLYRIAALFHDVGHYPYSHATEEAIFNHYTKTYIKPKAGVSPDERQPLSSSPIRSFKHDRVSKEILLKDKEIRRILKRLSIEPKDISSIFLREAPHQFANLVSSDLDADRIDYLLRTARHTGLPYGSVDIDYLLSQVSLDAKKRISLSAKALRTADHFLLCRYFDYQQVTYHKTVVAFELVLKDVVSCLLSEGMIKCSADEVSIAITRGEWCQFDDAYIFGKIRELSERTTDKVMRVKSRALLYRHAPKLIAEEEIITKRQDNPKEFLGKRQAIQDRIEKWSRKYRIDRTLWYVWPSRMALTKIGSHIPASRIEDNGDDDQDKLQQAIWVRSSDGESSYPIMEAPNSLMSVLADYEANTLRLYVLFPDGKEVKRDAIRKEFKEEFPNFRWK